MGIWTAVDAAERDMVIGWDEADVGLPIQSIANYQPGIQISIPETPGSPGWSLHVAPYDGLNYPVRPELPGVAQARGASPGLVGRLRAAAAQQAAERKSN